MVIFLVISGICIVCGVVMVSNVRAIFGTGLTDAEYNTAKVLMALMVFNLALTFPNSVFDAFTSAYERFVFSENTGLCTKYFKPFFGFAIVVNGIWIDRYGFGYYCTYNC